MWCPSAPEAMRTPKADRLILMCADFMGAGDCPDDLYHATQNSSCKSISLSRIARGVPKFTRVACWTLGLLPVEEDEVGSHPSPTKPPLDGCHEHHSRSLTVVSYGPLALHALVSIRPEFLS